MNNSKLYVSNTPSDLSTLSGGRPSVPPSRHPDTRNGRKLLSYAIAVLVLSLMLYAFLLSLSWFRDDNNKRIDLRPGLIKAEEICGDLKALYPAAAENLDIPHVQYALIGKCKTLNLW